MKTLFESNQKLNFQYEEYDMVFYSGEFCSYYIVFFLKKQEELMTLWECQGDCSETERK